jgi:hypothetical protein
MSRFRSPSPDDPGAVVSTRPPRPGETSRTGLSRRQFLRYTAVGASVLAVGGAATAEAIEALGEKNLCAPKTFFVPFLAIDTFVPPSGRIESPDIWLTATPDVNAAPATALEFYQPYYAVARIHNRGSAPVFNATVNLYEISRFRTNRIFPALSALSRLNTNLLDTQYTSVQPRSDRLVLFRPPLVLRIEDLVGVYLIVECFDPLSDMVQAPPDGNFNLGNDRHVAAVFV